MRLTPFICKSLCGGGGHRAGALQLHCLRQFTRAFASGAPIEPSDSTSLYQFQEVERGMWSKLWLFVPGAIAFGIATYHIFLLREKVEILEYRCKRLEMLPINLNTISSNDTRQSLEFRRVECKGVLDDRRSIFVGPRPKKSSNATKDPKSDLNTAKDLKKDSKTTKDGYYVITPLMPIPGDRQSVQFPVLVNRGWVPCNWKEKFLEVNIDVNEPMQSSPSSPLGKRSPMWKFWSMTSERNEKKALSKAIQKRVVGVIRESEKPNIFTPANDPSSTQWVYIDVPIIADALGLPQNIIYVEEVDNNPNFGNHYPAPKDTINVLSCTLMPKDHKDIIATWYAKSFAATSAAYWMLKKRF